MNAFLLAFTKGAVFGFTMAAIPGPIFFLIAQRALAQGTLVGLACGLGAVMADTVYAAIAVAGLTAISNFLIAHQALFTLFGGLFLIYLGVTTIFKKVNPITAVQAEDKKTLAQAWFTTFLLTVTNPVTIIAYTLMFAGLEIATDKSNASMMVIPGVIAGAGFFVVVLVGFLHFFRTKFSTKVIKIFNQSAGVALIIFGCVSIGRTVMTFLSTR